nr:disease resistance protein RPP13-like isoform X6 [Ipomoea batatas]
MRNLKKLSFWYTNFRWEEINILSSLPRLEVIKLGHRACVGQKWELREEEIFCELVFLEFGWHDFEFWEVNDDHFPNLERLVLNNCYRLKEIPSNFEDIPTLKSIELKSCLPSAVNSAKQIQENQHEYGNNNMVVIVEADKRVATSEEKAHEHHVHVPELHYHPQHLQQHHSHDSACTFHQGDRLGDDANLPMPTAPGKLEEATRVGGEPERMGRKTQRDP